MNMFGDTKLGALEQINIISSKTNQLGSDMVFQHTPFYG